MARKISSGVVGRQILGSIVAQDNTFKSVVTGDDLVLSPASGGEVESTTHFNINNNNELRLIDGATNYVGLKSPATVNTSHTLTLPASDGTANQMIITDGSGNLSFTTPYITIDDNGAAPGDYAIMMTNAADNSTITTALTALSKLKLQPSSGALTAIDVFCTDITVSTNASLGSNVDINGGAIDGTAIGAASASTGAFTTLTATSITETSSIAYKENVNPITNALESVLSLAGVTYDRKDGSSTNEAGLIAEDTANVLPNLVTYKDGKPDGINYTKLSAYLIEAVKELKAEIKELKGKK